MIKNFLFCILSAGLTISLFAENQNKLKKESIPIKPIHQPVKAYQTPHNILLFTALPASGKSEVRRYLDNLDKPAALKEFNIQETIQLDDFPYVHIMREVSREMINQGLEGAFFRSTVLPFKDPHDWGTLAQLINLEYEDIALNQPISVSSSAADWLFARIDRARKKTGKDPIFSKLSLRLRKALAAKLEKEAVKILTNLNANIAKGFKDKTVVIEFSRGGASASSMPLPAPYGYQHTLSQLSPQILERAAIIYIQVSPSDSLRKNTVRSNPNDPGSILNHKVPLAVMYADYGCDDMFYLKAKSDKPNTICVEKNGKKYFLPLGIFDNRDDKTTFLREDKKLWNKEDIQKLHSELKTTFEKLKRSSATSKD